MKAFINHHLFTQTSLDSGSLTMLGSVIHTLPKPGEYEGRVILGTQTTATFRLSIGTDFRATQVNIDLALRDTAQWTCGVLCFTWTRRLCRGRWQSG